MNRSFIISLGILILLLVVGLWVYLLAYGAPEKPREVFTNLGFFSSSTPEVRVIDPTAEQNPGVQLVLGGSPLQQLTTRAVAGFAFLPNASRIRYIERGTGHAFEINLEDGTEQQISLTTVPQTSEAVFSSDGETVVLTVYEGYIRNTLVGSLGNENELILTQLPEGADNVAFEDDTTIHFTLENGGITTGYAFDIPTQTRTEVANIPYASGRVLWGEHIDGIYTYSKPGQFFESGLYKVTSTLSPIGSTGYGLVAFAHKDTLVISSIADDIYTSRVVSEEVEHDQPLLMLPEKCVFDSTRDKVVWCAAPQGVPDAEYVGDWYKGTLISKDFIWFVDLDEKTSHNVADLSTLSGRTIDVDSITRNDEGSLILLRNKLDGALWLYRIPVNSDV